MEEALIQYKNVEIHQQELCVLSGVNLELHKGEFVYLIGKVGSGKTSLLKTLYGELDVIDGDAEVLGYNMRSIKRKHIPQLRRKLGIVFQDFQLLTDRTVYNNLEFVLRATGWKNKQEIKERIEEVLDLVGMSNKGYKIPNELSGGEELKLKYYSSIFDSTELKCEEINSLYNEYLERLNNSFQRELKMRYTVLGVHRDDMNLYIDNNDVKEFGSQGQQRSTALALKLAEAEIIRQKDETPIMILDDVLSELDAGRQRFVLNHIINSQVFITCCNINDVKELKNGKVWKVENGIFTEE